jgi:hypothetical protein
MKAILYQMRVERDDAYTFAYRFLPLVTMEFGDTPALPIGNFISIPSLAGLLAK